jgi:hypothetical protein
VLPFCLHSIVEVEDNIAPSDLEQRTEVLIPPAHLLTDFLIQAMRTRLQILSIAALSQPSSHPALNGQSTFLLSLNTNELMRQPTYVRTFLSAHVFRARKAVLELPSNGVDAVN